MNVNNIFGIMMVICSINFIWFKPEGMAGIFGNIAVSIWAFLGIAENFFNK